jgi:hypothetical protein
MFQDATISLVGNVLGYGSIRTTLVPHVGLDYTRGRLWQNLWQ